MPDNYKAKIASPDEGPCARKKHKPNPPDFSDPNSLVTFIIVEREGGEVSKFTVHKEVACYHSPVLGAAFNSPFVEGQTQTYRLEDTTKRAFKLLVQWLYSKKLLLQQRNGLIVKPAVSKAEDASLAELWVLADKLCIPRLQNAALKAIDDVRVKVGFSTSSFVVVYNCTVSGSQLRKYFVRHVYFRLMPSDINGNSEKFPHEMLIELAVFHAKQTKQAISFDFSDLMVPVDEDSESDEE